MICKIEGCEDRVHAKGWCQKHYRKWKKYNDPLFTKRHGYSDHPLYSVWQNMRARCYYSSYNNYKDYGGRGITVCDEWENSAKTFIEWAKTLWEPGLQIDRRDNNGNYTPENCRFVTPKENTLNRRLLQSNNKSGYCGVHYHIRDKKWIATICINKIHQHLGYFNTAKEAAMAYDNAIPDNRPRNFK
jgi:hypothetical protein